MNGKVLLTTLLGCLFIVIGVVFPLVFPAIFEAKLAEKLLIAPNSEMLKTFEKTPIPVYFEVYFFNITNPDEMYDGEKPILAEIGPYTYREEIYKHNITWNHDRGTVSYNEQKLYFFVPEKSVGSEDDEITTLNPVFVTVAAKADKLNFLIQSAMQLWTWQFEEFTLFMTRPIKELTFNGYDDPVVLKLYEMTEKPKYAGGKTGFLYPKNGTILPRSEIYSGEKGMENYQHVYKYDDETELTYWRKKDCNMINGTFGSQFAKPVSKIEKLYMFSADLCRSMFLVYEKDTKLGPLTLNRFILDETSMDTTTEHNKECYCTDEFTCRPSMVTISPCRDGAPILMSAPHFLMANQSDIDMVEGINPLKSKHITFLEIEPNTGVTMRVAKKLQVNIALRRYSAFNDFEYLQEVILPIFWINENAEVPMVRAKALHESLTGPKQMVGYLSLIMIAVGVLFVVVTLGTLWFARRKEEKRRKLQEIIDREANNKLINGYGNEKSKH